MPRSLSKTDEKRISECLRAAVEGPFFPEWEFQTLFGLTRFEVAEVLAAWPNALDSERVDTAVVNSLNNLLGYPHGQERVWDQFISATEHEVAETLETWRAGTHVDTSGKGYFDRLA